MSGTGQWINCGTGGKPGFGGSPSASPSNQPRSKSCCPPHTCCCFAVMFVAAPKHAPNGIDPCVSGAYIAWGNCGAKLEATVDGDCPPFSGVTVEIPPTPYVYQPGTFGSTTPFSFLWDTTSYMGGWELVFSDASVDVSAFLSTSAFECSNAPPPPCEAFSITSPTLSFTGGTATGTCPTIDAGGGWSP